MNITIHENGAIIDDDDETGEAEYEQMRAEYSGDFEDDGADDWFWCPTCGEMADLCISGGSCPTGQEAKRYREQADALLNELESQ